MAQAYLYATAMREDRLGMDTRLAPANYVLRCFIIATRAAFVAPVAPRVYLVDASQPSYAAARPR